MRQVGRGALSSTAVVAVLASASCASLELPSGATAAGPAAPTPSASLNGAPKVTTPLDTAAFQDNPCNALTGQQINELGANAQGKPNPGSALGPSCEWTGNGQSLDFSVDVHTKNEHGIGEVYAAQRQYPNKYRYFIPVSIQGYPGVFASESDDRGKGVCSMEVGVTDNIALAIDFSAWGSNDRKFTSDPCSKTQAIADDVVTNLKRGR